MKRFLSAFALLCGCAIPCWASPPDSLGTVGQIHALTNEQAAQSPAVSFEATVTYFRGYEKTLFVQDEGAGIYVAATTNLALVPGDRVRIRGTAHDSFRPIVSSSDITLLHHGELPAPVAVDYQTLVRANADCLYVTVRGTVRSAEMQLSSGRTVTQLEVRMDGGYLRVVMDNSDPAKLNGLTDAEVEINGVDSGRFDGKMQQTGVLIHTTDFSGVHILSPPAMDAWSIPATRMDLVLRAANTREMTERVRVEGTITYYQPASMAILQDASHSIRVLTSAINPLRVGDRGEAIGIPFVDNGFLTLKLGQIRATGAAGPIVPVPVTWDDLASGKHSFDLVSIEGTVVTQVREHAQDVYIISTGGHLFTAAVRHPFVYQWEDRDKLPPMQEIELRSRVRVTGVAILDDGNPFNGAAAFGILLRNGSDVIVLERPSPLTVPHLILLVLLLLAIVLAVGARSWAVERKMRRQSLAMAYVEHRRSRILEDINGSRPIHNILEQITELMSCKLDGAPCWCRLADGTELGNRPGSLAGFRTAQEEIPARAGGAAGTLFAAFDALSTSRVAEPQALAMGAALAALAMETRRLYSDLMHRSEFDLLTDTLNRFSLGKRLDDLIAQGRESAVLFGLIYIDLDHFKQINDVHGHQVGDLFLQEVALRMKQQIRSVDALARIGGDEFAALLPDVHSRADVEEIAGRLRQCFDAPFALDNVTLKGSVSVGFALYPQDATTKDLLCHAADVAMYAAKNRNRRAEHGGARGDLGARSGAIRV